MPDLVRKDRARVNGGELLRLLLADKRSPATKRAYAAQGEALLKYLRPRTVNVAMAGLAAVLRLPDRAPDLAIAREAAALGLAPTPLSLWYASKASARPGLLLGIATSPLRRIAASSDRLLQIIDRLT